LLSPLTSVFILPRIESYGNNNPQFSNNGNHIASAEKSNSGRVFSTVPKQRSKTTEIACEQCGIVYHNSFTFRVRKLYVSGQNLLKRLAIPCFYQENILTKACVYAMIFPASE